MRVFYYEVPFVYKYDDAFHLIDDHPGYVGILGGATFNSVDQQQNNIRSFNRLERTQNRIFFNTGLDPSPAPDPRGIDESNWQALVNELCINRISGCAGYGRDDNAFLT